MNYCKELVLFHQKKKLQSIVKKKTMAKVTKSSSKTTQNEVSTLHEEKESTHPLLDSIYDASIKVASTNVGQFAIRKVDKLLWTIENTAKWSVPQLYSESYRQFFPQIKLFIYNFVFLIFYK